MKDLQCEFCTKFPTMKFVKNDYVRYCCNDHKERLRRLLHLDLGIDAYSFEKVKPFIKTKDQVFVDHIQNHLTDDQVVCCKICDQTIDEIYQKHLEKTNG